LQLKRLQVLDISAVVSFWSAFEDSDLAMRSLGVSTLILVASPALIAAHGEPQALADIGRMPTLSMGTVGKEHAWRLVDADSKPVDRFIRSRDCGRRHQVAS
jgi:hypothetical protein